MRRQRDRLPRGSTRCSRRPTACPGAHLSPHPCTAWQITSAGAGHGLSFRAYDGSEGGPRWLKESRQPSKFKAARQQKLWPAWDSHSSGRHPKPPSRFWQRSSHAATCSLPSASWLKRCKPQSAAKVNRASPSELPLRQVKEPSGSCRDRISAPDSSLEL